MTKIVENLRLMAMDRHRRRLFGELPLKLFTMSPEEGEEEAAELTQFWRGQRIEPMTDDKSRSRHVGAWQFEIAAEPDWQTSQTFMDSVVSLTVGGRRWVVQKVEKPVGISFVWKLRCEIK